MACLNVYCVTCFFPKKTVSRQCSVVQTISIVFLFCKPRAIYIAYIISLSFKCRVKMRVVFKGVERLKHADYICVYINYDKWLIIRVREDLITVYLIIQKLL